MFLKHNFNFCLLICILCFFLIVFLCYWCFLCVQNLFIKKNNNKKFKIALITSFILLLNFTSLQAWTFLITIFFSYHNFFSIITIFFYYHNFFQLSQFFSIITTFFIRIYFITTFFNLFTTCDTIFLKISFYLLSLKDDKDILPIS